jgi:tellurite resistance protein TehA-like permease
MSLLRPQPHLHAAKPAPGGFASRMRAWMGGQIATLSPGAFAFVMATGVISNTLLLEGGRVLADALFGLNAIAYAWLALGTLGRALRHRPALWADLTNPRLVFGFFTLVAGTDVLGAGFGLRGLMTAALLLWVLALVLWLALLYLAFGVLVMLDSARGAGVVHGGWLIAIVATESLVVLGVLVAPSAPGEIGRAAYMLLHMLWGVGLGLYAVYVTLFAYRIFFFEVVPDELSPVLWVVMGAAAITVNAGAVLAVTDTGMPFLLGLRPVIEAVTLCLWGWATWWIPLLVLLGFWKHGLRRVPLAYTPMLWGLVFPLGMYALASLRLGAVAAFAPLETVSRTMICIAVAVWAATLVGLAGSCWRSFRTEASL